MRKLALMASVVLGMALLAPVRAQAEGIVQSAGKNAVKGAVKGVKQEVNSGEMTRGAKEVTKGVLDGAADAAPLITSQVVNQANVNKKAMGKVARTVTSQAVAGAFGATVAQVQEALGPQGEGPLADTLVATTERITAAVVKGVQSQISVPQVHIPVWSWVIAFILGGLSTVLFGCFLLLLYIAFSRRTRVAIAEPIPTVPASAVPTARTAFSMSG